MNNIGSGGMKIDKIIIKQMSKMYFQNYSEAKIYISENNLNNEIFKESGRYYIFIDESQKKQSI